VALVQLEQRQVPGQVAVERRGPVVVGQPGLEEAGAGAVVGRLVEDVGHRVGPVGVARVALQRLLGVAARLLEPIQLVVDEGVG
jgi:hypothetical protein